MLQRSTALGADPQAKSEPAPRTAGIRRNRKKTRRGRTDFAVLLPQECRLRQDTHHKTAALCFLKCEGERSRGQGAVSFVRAATLLQLPTPLPAGVASPMAKGCAIDILKTHFSVLHRYIAFRFGDRFRSVSFWWQDKYPVRDTGCAEGKRMYLTSKNQNASTVRKVLPGLRGRRNEGDGEMW